MEILSWGANSNGQLGQGSASEQVASPQAVVRSWSGEAVQVCGGGAHSLLIDSLCRIYACGWNLHRQLGFDDKECHEFRRIWELSGINFTSICAGWNSSAAITESNFLYLWGSNAFGQLGLPTEHFPDNVKPIQLELKVKQIAMGMRHTVLVDVHGCAWATGSGKRGQLGLGTDTLHSDTFQKIKSVNRFEKVTCGQHHTLVWDKEQNAIYSCGDNSRGQVGLDRNSCPQVFVLTKVPLLLAATEVIRDVQAGWTHSAVLLDGDALYWGRNDYGQLASTQREQDIQLPQRVSLKGGVRMRQLSVGSEHSVCLAQDGSLWAWGWNEHANTGTGDLNNVTEPLPVKTDSKNIRKIFSGTGHNFILLQ